MEYPIWNETINILLVENDSTYAARLQSALASEGNGRFRIEWVKHLNDALERLGRRDIALILLDLTLSDAQGLDAFEQVSKSTPNALILILSLAQDKATARQAVQRGAYDYFIKDKGDLISLSRTLRYAIDSKAAEARFRAISDASPLGIFVSDEGGSCIYTNLAYQRISGLDFDQALGTNWINAIHPDDRKSVVNAWRAAVSSNAPFQTECRFLQKSASVVWTRVSSATMHGEMVPYGRVQTVEDITDRKLADISLRQAEAALFVEKERAQVTLSSIGDAVLATDSTGNITYLNPMAEHMTGWSSAEAQGLPISQVFNIINGTTREVAANPAMMATTEAAQSVCQRIAF